MGTVTGRRAGATARQMAERAADALLESAIVVGDRAAWLGPTLSGTNATEEPVDRAGEATLYDGSAGIALACLAVGTAGQREDLVDTAVRAARHALDSTERVPSPGLYDGLAGIGLAALAVGVHADTRMVRSATTILDTVRAHPPDRSDLIGGLAGVALAFVRAAELTGDDRWVAAARGAAQLLVGRADRRPWGWAWPEAGDDPGLCGLAHGAAGPAWALAEVAAACGEPNGFEEAIAGARQYERSWFDPRSNSWPDLRPDAAMGQAPPRPALWCHGSVGIGISRLAIDACRPHPALQGEVAAAMQSAYAAAVDQLDGATLPHGLTVCHGLAGTIDFLVDAHVHDAHGLHLETAGWLAERAFGFMGDDAARWPGGIRGYPGPGLMNGLAGTMAVLCRLSDPHGVPSVGRLAVMRPDQ